MQPVNKSQIKLIPLSLLAIILFNIYYFFIKVESEPLQYIKNAFWRSEDHVCESSVFRDLTEEYHYLNQVQNNKSVIVFLGDSITKRFNVQEYFPDQSVLNRGIYSDTTLGLLNRLDLNINNLNIYKLFIMIGFNDLQYRTNAEILANVSEIVTRVKAREVFIQSILPVDSRHRNLNNRIVEINEGLNIICTKMACSYIDIHSNFLDNENYLSSEYSFDGIHPNFKGNKVWANVVKKYILSSCSR